MPWAPANAPTMHGFGRNHPLCGGGCGAYARPNVHFFDPNEGYLAWARAVAASEERGRWEARVAERCARGEARLAVVEVGCGTMVQTLRSRIDMLLAKCSPRAAAAALRRPARAA